MDKVSEESNVEDKRIDKYAFKPKNCLGQGQFGTVYRGLDTKTGKDVAVKVIPGVNLND